MLWYKFLTFRLETCHIIYIVDDLVKYILIMYILIINVH